MRRWLVLAAVLLLGLSAWTHPTELRVAVRTSPRSLEPLHVINQDEFYLASLAFDLLVTQDGAGHLVPDLAETVPSRANGGISADGRTIVYRLRHNVRWHDGAPFTSADVAFTWRAIMDPHATVESRDGYDRVRRVEVPDPYTVVFRLREPYAPFVRTVFSEGPYVYFVEPAHLLDHATAAQHAAFAAAPVGTGPYRFVSWTRGDHLEYAANPAYFGGAPAIARLRVSEIPDSNTLGIAIQRHDVDLGQLTALQYARFKDTRDVRRRATLANGFDALWLQATHPPLDDVRVRRAIARAIDKAALVRTVLFGAAVPATSDLPDGLWSDGPVRDPNAYDPAAAAALLDAAGWHRSAGGVRTKNGTPLHLALADVVNNDNAQHFDVQIQAQLRAAGIDVEIKPYRYELLTATAAEGGILRGGRFDLARQQWIAGIDQDNSVLFTCAAITGGENLARLCDPRMDAAQRDALATYDERRRRAAYARIERLMLEDVPMVAIDHPLILAGENPDLVRPAPNFVEELWNIGRWHFGAP